MKPLRRCLVLVLLPGSLLAHPSDTLADAYEGERPLATFRIIFGMKDEAPRSWAGEVLPADGQRRQVEADRFRNYDFLGSGRYLDQERFADFPNDRLLSETAWTCASRFASMFSIRGLPVPPPILLQPTLLVHLREGSLETPVRVRTVVGEFSFRPSALAAGRRAEFLDGNVRVELSPRIARVATARPGKQDFPSLVAARSGRLWLAWQEFDGQGDAVVVRADAAEQQATDTVLASGADVFQTAIGEAGGGRIWVVWSMQVEGNWDLYGRAFDGREWSPAERLTADAGTDFYHRLQTDSEGRLWLVWQRLGEAGGAIYARSFDRDRWTKEECVSAGLAGGNWSPAVATGPGGLVAVAWDSYEAGNYDVFLRRRRDGAWGPVERVAGTARFEAQPALAIDPDGRIWIAWNESGANWGKDTGFLVVKPGTQLYESRAVRLACLDGDRWMTTPAPPPLAQGPDDFWQMPWLQIDASGRPNLVVRHLLMRRPLTPKAQPTNAVLWGTFATRFDGAQWSDPVYLPRATGRNEMLPATTVGPDGGLWGAWATDSRSTKAYNVHLLRIQLAAFGRPGAAQPVQLRPLELEPEPEPPLQPEEPEQVARMRAYRIEHGGKSYAIYRGDLHRHTDISIDGGHDGSLLDAYRYAWDAAALDFISVTNHLDGGFDPYNWWLHQKAADLFRARRRLETFYGYERSVEFPNGHRNVFAIKRGTQFVEINGSELSGEEGCERLYAYLRETGGFCISHTTGRTSGTDWRNHDPAVESLVEIYQGERDVYEHPGGPKPMRLWSEWLDPSKPVPIESSQENSRTFRRQGFVWNALAKGYRLGFIASSDHTSTHVSYACLLAEDLTRESLRDAVRARRAYGATDNIILDVRGIGSDGEHLMGDAFASTQPLRLRGHVIGTGELLQVDIIKDGAVVQTYGPQPADFSFEYEEPAPKTGESYYYVRVIQRSGDMAWGSPVWVTYP